LSNSEPNNLDEYFKESIEKKSKGYYFQKTVDEDGLAGMLLIHHFLLA
jgi:hypothetical protein